MTQPFVGEIRLFAGNFAPEGWGDCDGGIMAISENETLFQLIGTTYGGDGQSTFARPDLRGRAPVHNGQGQGQPYVIGQKGGVETVTLTIPQMPRHNHRLATAATGLLGSPKAAILGNAKSQQAGVQIYSTNTATPTTLHPDTIAPTGGSQPHTNMQPYLVVRYIISLFGIFPPQS